MHFLGAQCIFPFLRQIEIGIRMFNYSFRYELIIEGKGHVQLTVAVALILELQIKSVKENFCQKPMKYSFLSITNSIPFVSLLL